MSSSHQSTTLAKQSVRIAIAIIGAALGPALLVLILSLLKELDIISQAFIDSNSIYIFIGYIVCSITFGLLFYFLSTGIIKNFRKLISILEKELNAIPFSEMVSGTIGLIVGLVLAFLISTLIMKIPLPGVNITITVLIYLVLAILGWRITTKKSREMRLFEFPKKEKATKEKSNEIPSIISYARPKVLDTSVIIDGRIFDVCKTGIIEGELIIPGFVLQELRHISDSSDGLKRNRGRRGLDILNRIQKELDIPVKIVEKDYEDIVEVDEKLLKLAQELSGVVVTNDYNLNKVAAVHEILVLNINELANAVKPVVMPGEEMQLVVMKVGKEAGQGIAYLDDGTMIVVEGGRNYLGESITTIVTSVLQTSAGRMIFAKVK